MTEEPTTTEEPQDPAEDPAEPAPADPGEEPFESEPDAEPDAEPAPAEPSGPTPEALVKAEKRFEGAVLRYLTQVSEYAAATGQEFFRTGVDLSYIPGFIFDPRKVPLDEEQMTGARVLAGLEIEPTFNPDPLSEECRTCGGEGRCATPSKVKGERIVECPTCMGHGFTGERLSVMLKSGVPVQRDTLEPAADGPPPPAPLDAWGTPLGHPGFGQNPGQWPAEWHDQLRGMGYGNYGSLNAVAS